MNKENDKMVRVELIPVVIFLTFMVAVVTVKVIEPAVIEYAMSFDSDSEPYIHGISGLNPPLNNTWYCEQLAEQSGAKNAFNFTMVNDNSCEYWSE
jgi:hypothetical protein